jgi:SAM-dependent methyltransferase
MTSNLQKFLVKLALKQGLYASRYKTYANILQRFVKITKENRRKVVCLDLGCGDGFFTQFLVGLCNLSIGVDLNEYPAWRYRDNSFFIVADARKIPLHSNSIDLVIIISLLEHVPNWRSIVAETSRILKLGGLVVIQLPNLHALIEPHTKVPFISFMPVRLRNLLTISIFRDVLQWDCSLQEVTQALKDSSLKILGVFHFAYMLKLKPLAFSYFIIAMKNVR